MLFNSWEFILAFLPFTFFVYFWLNKHQLVAAAKTWLVAASLFFYSWWGIVHLPLIVVSILVNYAIGTALGADGNRFVQTVGARFSRKALLASGLIFNIGLLAYFKYANFFVDNLNAVTGSDFQLAKIALPLAISFFTFQKIAYLIDSYRDQTRNYNFLDYALFVTFFPQLIAGPIVHHKEIVPQFTNHQNLAVQYPNIALGLAIFSIGLFKKVIIADTFAQWATPGFDTAATLNFVDAWATSLSYTFQLYFDFSGYTDMAIGAALLFNIRLPINFDSPYKATSIQDFWRRWHITLSNFLRDYVYIPLGGNRKGEAYTYLNLFITFLIGGLWHGASWMFIIWGALHGGALVIHRIWQRCGMRLPPAIAWFITFNFVNFTWIFFRANDMDAAFKVIRGMLGLEDSSIKLVLLQKYQDFTTSLTESNDLPLWVIEGMSKDIKVFLSICLGSAIALLAKNTTEFYFKNKVSSVVSVSAGILFAIAFISVFSGHAGKSEFLYFNF